jgi:hypothetical protein
MSTVHVKMFMDACNELRWRMAREECVIICRVFAILPMFVEGEEKTRKASS